MASETLSYVIDDQDRLVKVDESFYRFAAENDWDGASDVLGRSLWEFVAGSELEKLQRMLLRRIRSEIGSVELPFRCDGPDATRLMSIRISAYSSGRFVSFSARLEAERLRRHQPLLSAKVDRGEGTLTMCGWCDRFLVEERWVPVEEAAALLGLFMLPQLPAISHGICSDCAEMLIAA